jgi:nucleotide-binding universal stress UspA family protein
MTLRLIEVPCYAGIDLTRLLDAALRLARAAGAHLEVTHVTPDPSMELAMLPPAAYALDALAIPALEKIVAEDAKRQKAVFDHWCQQNDVPHQPDGNRLDQPFARWNEIEGAIETVVMTRGRLADLTVVSRPGGGDAAAGRCFDTAVFATGRPAMVVGDSLPDRLLRHVIVAWNGSLEATRAVSLAMPILHEAERVSIFTSRFEDEPDAPDLAGSLRWHGIEAHALAHRRGEEPVGRQLIEAARTHDASLVVMGAYTHSRLREILLGGVTHDILRASPVPVVMAH